MPNLPWFKVYTEIIDDPKLRPLSDAQKWRFLQLLALAGECGSEGYLVHSGEPLLAEDIAWRLRIATKVILKDLQALARLQLVSLDEVKGAWLVPGFARRQAPPDEGKRAYWREQKRRQRSAFSHPTKKDPGQEPPTQSGDPNPLLDLEEAFTEVEISGQSSAVSSDSGCENYSEFEQEDGLGMSGEDFPDTFQEDVPLKRRIEEKRGEKREKERRRGERQRPPPAGRQKAKPESHLSVYDQVERELAKKRP